MEKLIELRKILEAFAPCRFASENEANESLWQGLAGGYDLLRGALREAVHDDQSAAPEVECLLEECWNLLRAPLAGQQMTRYFLPNRAVDASRLQRNACAMVATAGAARSLRQAVSEPDAWGRFLGWWQRGADALGAVEGDGTSGLPSITCDGAKTNAADPWELIAYACQAVSGRGWPVKALRRWTEYWLGKREGEDGRRALRLPVVGYGPGGGFVGRLELEKLWGDEGGGDGEKKGELVEDPEVALEAYERDLVETVREEWAKRGCGDVCWGLKVRGRMVVGGESLGAAVAVGLSLLRSGRAYDADCVLTAAVGEGDVLRKVGHEREKLEAAVRAGIRRVGVAEGSELREAVIEDFRSRGLEVRALRTVGEAEEYASGLAAGLRDYFELLIELPDRPLRRPAYLGSRKPSEVYVEPDVLKRERVPDPRQGDRAGDEGGREFLAAEALEIGEQPLYQKEHGETEHRAAWQEELEGLRRGYPRGAMVLGPPGQGKSQLVMMAVREVGSEAREALNTQEKGVDQVALPISLTFRELASGGRAAGETAEEALRSALFRRLRGMGCQESVAGYVAQHAHEGRAWLFVDALDELPEEGQEVTKEFFEVLNGWQCHVVMTSRPYGYAGWRLPFAVTEYRLAPLGNEQAMRFTQSWYGEEDDEGQRTVADLLQRSASVRQVGQNPFLLTLLCWGAERHQMSQEMTRTELYDLVVKDLLGLTEKGPVDGRRGEELMPLLTEVAFSLFRQTAGKKAIRHEEMLKLMEGSEKRPVPQGLSAKETARLTARQQGGYLIEELCRKRVLAPIAEDRSAYVFTHRSVGEYLAGRALAERLEEGEDKDWEMADKKAWDPDWEQVLMFAAGRLSGNTEALERLLTLLADENKDDVFRHRLGLAAQCLAEIPRQTRDAIRSQADQITNTVFSVWWEQAIWQQPYRESLEAPFHLTRALPALGQVAAMYSGTPLTQWLMDRLVDGHSERDRELANAQWRPGMTQEEGTAAFERRQQIQAVFPDPRNAAVEALKRVVSISGATEVCARLLELVTGEKFEVQKAGAEVLGTLARRSGRTEVLMHLGELLANERVAVRSAAAEAIRTLGSKAAASEFLGRAVKLIQNEDRDIRYTTISALRNVGSGAVNPEFLQVVIRLLRDNDSHVRFGTQEMLFGLGNGAAVPEFLGHLSEMLGDEDWAIRESAVWAISCLNTPRLSPELLVKAVNLISDEKRNTRFPIKLWFPGKGLPVMPEVSRRVVQLLKSDSEAVRRRVLQCVPGLGGTVATPEVVSAIENLLTDGSAELRVAAARAVGSLQDRVSTNAILYRLADMLLDANRDVRCEAASDIGSIGAAAATPFVLEKVVAMSHESDAEAQVLAAHLIGRLGRSAWTPELVGKLNEWLESKDKQVCSAAAWEVRKLAREPFAVDFLPQLHKLLDALDPDQRRSAVGAIGAMGTRAATVPIVNKLRCLVSGRGRVRLAASAALDKMMSQGVRFFKGDSEDWEIRTVASLAS